MDTMYLLRKIRADHNLSQEAVAAAMGISTNSYKKLESGLTKIRLDHLERFGKIFQLNVVAILLYDKTSGKHDSIIPPKFPSSKRV